jgi:multimeric flavodoxin WrbA
VQTLAILGSRNPEGRTARAISALLAGAQESGRTEQIFLPQSDIGCCRQCDDDGWGTCIREGRCSVEDGFGDMVSRIRKANAVVFASPVYYGDLSESIRAFLDRLRRTCMHTAGSAGIKGKPAVGVCVAGGGGGGAPECCARLAKILSSCGFNVLDMLPVRRQNLEMKLASLNATGRMLTDKS